MFGKPWYLCSQLTKFQKHFTLLFVEVSTLLMYFAWLALERSLHLERRLEKQEQAKHIYILITRKIAQLIRSDFDQTLYTSRALKNIIHIFFYSCQFHVYEVETALKVGHGKSVLPNILESNDIGIPYLDISNKICVALQICGVIIEYHKHWENFQTGPIKAWLCY